MIRWHLQLGNVVIPKSVTPERIEQNIDVLDFELGADEMEAIAALDAGRRTGPDPDTFVRPCGAERPARGAPCLVGLAGGLDAQRGQQPAQLRARRRRRGAPRRARPAAWDPA